ncbi:class I SAM-dependent methyltransferase [Lutibacter sp.]
MKKINKIIKAFFLLIKKPSLINLILENDSVWEAYLTKNHKLKTTLPIVEINELIPNFNGTLDVFSFLGGGSLPTDILLLKELSKQIKNCSYFEIGTWRGESVINVASTAKECYTLNLSKQDILKLGLSNKYASLHGFFSKKNKNIKHLYGNSLDYDFGSLNKKFDLIFIDGNHKYEYTKNDTEKIFKYLVHENSIVVWHDYAYNPETIRPEVLSAILDGIPNKYTDNLYHVSNTLCAIYTNRKLKISEFEYPITPNKIFNTTLKIKDF